MAEVAMAHEATSRTDPLGETGWSALASDVVLRLIGATDDQLDGIVSETLAALATRCGAERGYVTFYDPIDGTFDISHEWTAGVVPHAPAIQRVPIDRFPWSVGLADRRETLVVHDLDELPPEADAERRSFGAFGVRSIIQVPIVHDGATVGVVGLNRFRSNAGWTVEMVELAQRVGLAVGIALFRQRSQREIAAARSRADEARRSRDELLAHVSHELRTPLHAILGYAELLELDDRSEHDRDALMRIQTNGRQLLGMIDDLARLAAGSDAARSETDVTAVIDELVDDLQPIAIDRGLVLQAGATGGSSDVEIERFRQVARCLVIGAAQSMRDGHVVVGAAVDPDGTELRVRLSSSQPIGPDGLVLPIAEALVQHSGAISVQASDDATTTDVVVRFAAVAG